VLGLTDDHEIVRIQVDAKIGDTVKELASSFARCGYVLVTGESAEQAQKLPLRPEFPRPQPPPVAGAVLLGPARRAV